MAATGSSLAAEKETAADKAARIAAEKAAKNASKAKKTEEPVLETADSEIPFQS